MILRASYVPSRSRGGRDRDNVEESANQTRQ